MAISIYSAERFRRLCDDATPLDAFTQCVITEKLEQFFGNVHIICGNEQRDCSPLAIAYVTKNGVVNLRFVRELLPAEGLALAASINDFLTSTTHPRIQFFEDPLRGGVTEFIQAITSRQDVRTLTKILYTRKIDNLNLNILDTHSQFSFRSIDETGEVAAEAVLEQVYKGSLDREPIRYARDEFADLKAGAGNYYNPKQWFVLYCNNAPAGVVFPQIISHECYGMRAGKLFYIGISSHFRCQGVGKWLHAIGLSLLARFGVSLYYGTVDIQNVPMRKILEANGCCSCGERILARNY